MKSFNNLSKLTGFAMFLIAMLVYMMSAEPTTSLWDCGEFISAAYKLEVVHPPGAPLFLMIGRMFAFLATSISDDPANIAYALNLMSGFCTALLVMFVCWSTIILAKLALVGRNEEPTDQGQIIAILGAGITASLATTFAASVWFSAVEGEVYAMSSGFTGLVLWASLRWYVTDHVKADRWLVFIAYMLGLSIGVHLLSLLVLPLLGVLYYYKQINHEDNSFPFLKSVMAAGAGFAVLVAIQYAIIPKTPQIAAAFDFVFVNSFGLPIWSGVLFFILLLTAGILAGLWYAHKQNNYHLHLGLMIFAMILIGFSNYGMVVLRASANPTINMNAPSDPYSLLSYINREQYGDRALMYGPHFMAERDPVQSYVKKKDVYRPVLNEQTGDYTYEIVDEKGEVMYKKSDYMLFPRLGHMDRGSQYRSWLGLKPGEKPTMGDNISFFFRYQIGWMYIRYFMWNFAGRQNAKQGSFSSDPKKGHWISGLNFLDAGKTYDTTYMPSNWKEEEGRSTYFMIPFLFGLLGLFFHFRRRPKEAFGVLVMFLMTGLAIIVFSNQPPQEPRERDYVLVGSIFAYCMWIGMAVPAIYTLLKDKIGGVPSAALGTVAVLIAPILMGTQNWDEQSRANHYGARDYAKNFLETCEQNAIIFTYGDNDTYPLWYAQEVENIRPDVRVVNFSLLAVDWYIEGLRRKVNESDRIKMTIPSAAYKGNKRNYLPIIPIDGKPKDLRAVIDFMGKDKTPPIQGGQNFASYIPAKDVFLPINKAEVRKNGTVPADFPDSLVADQIRFNFSSKQYLLKDEIALMDIVATNAANGWERPIYFAVTCRPEKIMGLKDYLQMEGMGLRIVPIRTPSDAKYGAMNMGRVHIDRMYDNMMNKFVWGNFDKEKMFIDESYMPSVHSLQYGFVRMVDAMSKDPANKEKSVAALNKFFEAFPHMNFPYEENRMCVQAITMFYRIGAEEDAKKHIRILTDAVQERQMFFDSLTDAKKIGKFKPEMQDNMFLIQNILGVIETGKDEEFKTEIKTKLAGYIQQQQLPN
ncbi:MAG: DUF2723 domain-containing protein [Aureispira sp.]|nr:DUF2723 domain-containing protein [Aureispira sp.]